MPIRDRFAKNVYYKIDKFGGTPLVSLLFAAFILASCGFGNSQSSAVGGGNPRSGTMETDIGLDELRELARPPEMGGSTIESANVRTVNGNFKDINSRKLLFEERIRDTDDRLSRIENAVQNLSNEFNDVSPAINRLVEIEGDLRELHDQLSLLINGVGENPDVMDEDFVVVAPELDETPDSITEKSAPVIAAPVPLKKASSAVPISSNLPNVRVADYPNKMRIVFETSKKEKFSRNFDKENQLLVINSPLAFSASALSKLKKSSKYIADVSVSDGANGTDIAIMTKNMSNVSNGAYIGTTPNNKNHRYYIDVMK